MNKSTSESIKELGHGFREGHICVIIVLVYQGYNDSIEGDVHHTIYAARLSKAPPTSTMKTFGCIII